MGIVMEYELQVAGDLPYAATLGRSVKLSKWGTVMQCKGDERDRPGMRRRLGRCRNEGYE